jgi:hypothetical protein
MVDSKTDVEKAIAIPGLALLLPNKKTTATTPLVKHSLT